MEGGGFGDGTPAGRGSEGDLDTEGDTSLPGNRTKAGTPWISTPSVSDVNASGF
jgi:hypothetical protein